jgi:class 3 adenylate cyclase/tetratricopeptide (TPR) repeat protein
MDVLVWLRSLGLERYEAAFRDNEIDERVLPSLTQEDLKEIGVGPVGHRRILLEAIAVLRGDTGGNAPSADVAATSSISNVAPEDRAERRQVTVMFSDLVGSTALSARMDPEDLREVISAYQRSVAEIVGRFGGFVAKYMGDGVLVYFGYPQAHEDDAERAVRAGLQLVTAVGDLKTHAALQTRIGIATGLVVVGDLIGSGASQEQAIVGDTPNLAARLQGVAEPNSVVVAESTRKLVGSLFELEDLGPQELNGISGLTRTWAALRPALVEGRFEAMHASGLTDLVGREEELDLLLRRWSKAKFGEGQVVLLSGEAGIGKSRLTVALLERLATEPHTRLRYFCSPQHTDSALYPIMSQMERAAGLTHDDIAQAKLDKLDSLLAQCSTSPQDAALFAEMLSLPNDGRYPALELIPQQRRQKILEAFTKQIETFARRSPVLMVFEDAHWADPTSLEAFGRAVMDRISALNALLIVTYRPEFEPPWIGQPHVTNLTLNRLGQREIAAMINRLTGNKPLLASVKQDIVERTDGIPLFIEEMTKAVLEADGQEDAERAAASIPTPSLAIPASLHASLMARLDRLGSAKEVAQIGAVIGREFSYALLAAVAGKEEGVLQAALDGLTGAGLLFRQGTPPQATYLFKHGLVQDTAYSTLLRDRRRVLHARIAEVLETQFPEIPESQPELVARHYTEADLIEKSVAFWAKAGRQLLARSALVEAIAQLSRALDQIATLTSTPALRREEIELQVAIISPLMNMKGFSSPEAKAAIERARVLIEQAEALGDPLENPLILYSLLCVAWATNFGAFNGVVLRSLAAQFLALAEKQGVPAPTMIGHSLVAYSLVPTGNFTQGRRHCDQAIGLYDPAYRPLSLLFGWDAWICTLGLRSQALGLLGYPEAALADANQGLKEARDLGHSQTLFQAFNYAIVIHFLCGNYATLETLANELLTFAEEQKSLAQWKPVGVTYRGFAFAATGRASEAVRLITPGLAAYRSAGATFLTPLMLSLLGKSYSELGQLDDAWRSLNEAKEVIESTGETWFEAHVHHMAGEIALKPPQPDTAKAEAHFERALAVARLQQAKSWELRAATSMARLWRDQGKPQQARELLASVYGWFTEGFNTPDLKEAKALLDQLASV